MSSPVPSAQQKDPIPGVMRLLPRLLFFRKLLLHLLFLPLQKTSSPYSWKCLWGLPRPRPCQSHKSAHSRLKPRIPILENLIWTATIFVISIKIILKHQVPQRWIVLYLPPFSSAALLTSDGPNTSAATKVPFWSRGLSSKTSSKRTLGTPRSLLIAFRASLDGTPNTN